MAILVHGSHLKSEPGDGRSLPFSPLSLSLSLTLNHPALQIKQ